MTRPGKERARRAGHSERGGGGEGWAAGRAGGGGGGGGGAGGRARFDQQQAKFCVFVVL
jgi:hypothetical protein